MEWSLNISRFIIFLHIKAYFELKKKNKINVKAYFANSLGNSTLTLPMIF